MVGNWTRDQKSQVRYPSHYTTMHSEDLIHEFDVYFIFIIKIVHNVHKNTKDIKSL